MKKDNQTESKAGCSVVLNIETTGDINIYNCSKPSVDKDCGCNGDDPSEQEPTTGPKGTCVPASTGSKPKQSKHRKLEKLFKNKPVPSVLAAAFLRAGKRFAAGKEAGSQLESVIFEKFRTLSPGMKRILKCTNQSFDALPSKYRKLFAGGMDLDIESPVDGNTLARSFGRELTGIVSGLALGNSEAPLEERPGKMRLYEISGEVFESQVRIFKINGLRTYDNIPRLLPGDFLPEELQQTCTPRTSGGELVWDCSIQTPPCDGIQFDSACLRVLQIQNGTSVTLEGVNFFDVNAKVHLRLKQSLDSYTEVDAFVYGDVDTALNETIGETERIIADNRVHDKIFFTIPQTLAPGIYEFMAVVPNTSGLPGFGENIASNVQYLEVIPPSTARFQVATERLWARKETSPQSWGSDEVGIKINAIAIFDDMTIETDPQDLEKKFGDVDSGETRIWEDVVFTHSRPIAGMIMSVIGFEIDGDEAYEKQITDWTDIFIDIIKEELKIISEIAAATGVGFKDLAGLGFWGYVAIAIAVAVTLAIDLFVALWAPADLIIEDNLAFSVNDLVRLTNINIPAPEADSDKTLYTTPGEIKVRLMLSGKTPNQYTEERGYISDDEDSWYNITFRYTRTA